MFDTFPSSRGGAVHPKGPLPEIDKQLYPSLVERLSELKVGQTIFLVESRSRVPIEIEIQSFPQENEHTVIRYGAKTFDRLS